jgi:hypothetical protein
MLLTVVLLKTIVVRLLVLLLLLSMINHCCADSVYGHIYLIAWCQKDWCSVS